MSYDLNRIPEVAASLGDFERECAITLALKITDDSCKMDDYERSVFMKVYDALPERRSDFFDPSVFGIIHEGRNRPSAQIFARIKPLRQAGMEYVTRPKMKAFKALVRTKLS
jgi:hypothetical protein